MKIIIGLIFLTLILAPFALQAQTVELVPSETEINIFKARVLEVLSEEERVIPGLRVQASFQTIRAEILEGEKKGEEVTLENDYFPLEEGEKFYLMESILAGDDARYLVHDKYRLDALWFFTGLFVLCIFIFGGIQGVRGLVSLIGSMLLIMFVLMPGILEGYSPILVTIGVASLIIVLGSYITHGFNKTTSSAVLGMIITVVITGALAYFAVGATSLSGLDTEEAVYLNFNTGGTINFIGLLFGGIMIGLLGVLYDVAIGQAISVEELMNAGKHLKGSEVFKRAVRIGREHIGALVNTLAIAYVGASLPLLLLFYGDGAGSLEHLVNREIFAAEIIRTMIGSIGLILAVPITTFIAVLMLVKREE